MNYILMNAPTALATQQGLKTQMRRIVDIPTNNMYLQSNEHCYAKFRFDENIDSASPFCVKYPYEIGQVLWVREPAKVIGTGGDNGMGGIEYMRCQYLSDGAVIEGVNIERFYSDDFSHLPSWITSHKGIPNGCIKEMARTFIRVTNIRVERLNEISEEDAIKEGIIALSDCTPPLYDLEKKQYCASNKVGFKTAKSAFIHLWESINGKDSFDNRWAWVIEYKLIDRAEATR